MPCPPSPSRPRSSKRPRRTGSPGSSGLDGIAFFSGKVRRLRQRCRSSPCPATRIVRPIRDPGCGNLPQLTRRIPDMIVDCAYYLDGHRSDVGPMSLQEAAARSGEGGFVWLGLFEPDEQELTEVRHIFGLHELAVEDAQNMHMRPKIESYDKDVQLIILRTARYDDDAEEVEFGEISVFLSPTFVIAVRQGIASELREARLRLEQRPELLAAGSSSALWAIMDQVVDGYVPVVAGLEHDIDQIEATVFSGAVAPTERIYSLRREATDFFRAVHPLLGVVGTVERMVPSELQPYLRDVRDHVLLVDEEVAAQRDLLGAVLEANMAVISAEQAKVSVQQNATI